MWRLSGGPSVALEVSRIASICLAAACGGSSGAQDAGPTDSFDGGSPAEASGVVQGNDAGGGSSNADASAVIAQCEALAMTFVHSCNTQLVGGVVTPDTTRACVWTGYAKVCETGRAQLLLDSMKCFGQNPSCWTFSDANTAVACLTSVHEAAGVAAALSGFVQQLCVGCKGAPCTADAAAGYAAMQSSGTSELIPYASDSDLSGIAACEATVNCSGSIATSCASVPDVAAILGCK